MDLDVRDVRDNIPETKRVSRLAKVRGIGLRLDIFRFLMAPASSISTITVHGDATFRGTPHYVRTIFIMKFDRLSFKQSRSAFQSAQYPRKAGCDEFCHRVDFVPSNDKFARPGILVRANLVFAESRYQRNIWLQDKRSESIHTPVQSPGFGEFITWQ